MLPEVMGWEQNTLREGWEQMKVIGQRVKGCYKAADNGTLGPKWARQGDGPEMANSFYRHEGLERARRKLGEGCSEVGV